jgi:hypothetical protein
MTEFCLAIQNLPTKPESANDNRFISNPKFKKCVDVFNGKNIFSPPPIPVVTYFASKVGDVEKQVKHGEKDPQKALDELTADVQRELDKYFARKGG